MNLNLVVDTSNFKPFDFKTLIAPLLLYNQEYEKDQAYYDKLSEQLGALSSAVQGTTNAKGIYDKYNSDFADAAEAFSHGMNINTRAKLDLLRTRYGTEIKQLELAREAMLKIVDARRALMASGKAGDMLYLDTGNLDTYLTNPNYTPMAYDGNLITAKAMADFKLLAEGKITLENYKELNPITLQILTRTGYDPLKILLAMVDLRNNNYDFNAILDKNTKELVSSVLNGAIEMSGVDSWGNSETKIRARRYAAAALPALVGKATISLYEDPYKKLALTLDTYEKLKAIDYRYKQKELLDTLNAMGANLLQGMAGSTVPLTFTDANASDVMKSKLANTTWDWLTNEQSSKKRGNEGAKRVYNLWLKYAGAKDPSKATLTLIAKAKLMAIEYWTKNGFDGDWLDNKHNQEKVNKGTQYEYSYYRLKDAIRKSVGGNESLVLTWVSPFIEGNTQYKSLKEINDALPWYAKPTGTSSVPITQSNYPNIKISGKNWKDFDKQSKAAYRVNGVDLLLDDATKEAWLKPIISRITLHGKTSLHSIKSIDKNGNVTYDNGTMNVTDLPTGDNKNIKYSDINVVMLHNHDFLLYWLDSEGNLYLKVLKANDISLEMRDLALERATAILSAQNLYSGQYLKTILGNLEDLDEYNTLMLLLQNKVKPNELK